MKKLLAIIVLFSVFGAHAYSYWFPTSLDITYDRPIHVNNNVSNDQYARIEDACRAWYWTGAKYRPYVVRRTWRDALYGNTSWPWDDDDGCNVIQNIHHSNSWLALSSFVDATDDEVDIQMNIRYSFFDGDHWLIPSWPTHPKQWSYQAVATHEIGHLMGLGHSSENPNESNLVRRNATMYYRNRNNESEFASINRDDIFALIARAGGWRKNQWQVVHNPGYDVQLPANANAVHVYINPLGQGSDWGDWVIVKKECVGGWVDADTRMEWQEYDRAHSAIISPYIIGEDGVGRELYYARNAPNWYTNPAKVGWPDMSSYSCSYNTWVPITVNIWNDYRNEYGVDPAQMVDVKIRHFVYTGWNKDAGCSVKNLYVRGRHW